jgi:N utilization substance protein A
MKGEDLILYVESISRTRDIPLEEVFRGLEDALLQGVRRKLGLDDDLVVRIDRATGEVHMEDNEEIYELDLDQLGRIVAQAVKQGFLQRVREAERDVLYDEYEARVGQLVNGQVRKDGSRVKIFVSRTHPDLVRCLFQLEVPEVSDEIIEVRRVVREPGYRTKMAVVSSDPKIDCIGACVGVRGSRIKAVIDELRGERIDIIRWSDSLEQLIMNGLKPALIHLDNIFPDVDNHRAIVIVDEDQQSLAIGKRGQNVRLASKLCGWDIEIKTRSEFDGGEGSEGELEGEGAIQNESAETDTSDSISAPAAVEEEASNEPLIENETQDSPSPDSEGSEPSDNDLETPADAAEATTEG